MKIVCVYRWRCSVLLRSGCQKVYYISGYDIDDVITISGPGPGLDVVGFECFVAWIRVWYGLRWDGWSPLILGLARGVLSATSCGDWTSPSSICLMLESAINARKDEWRPWHRVAGLARDMMRPLRGALQFASWNTSYCRCLTICMAASMRIHAEVLGSIGRYRANLALQPGDLAENETK